MYHQFSNGNTTIGASVSANESFKLGITYNAVTAKSDAELISQQQGAAMNFYTTSNLIAANRMTITSLGNVGINTLTPNSYLEINTAVPVATGSSGLQFTDLTTSSFLNNSFFTGVTKGVLSVDDNGKVVLVKDENGTPSNGITACTSPGINAVNFLTKISGTNQICKSGVYEDPTSNYVGIGNTFPQAKLHVQSTITNTASGYIGALVDLDVTYNAGAGGNATDVGLFVSSIANTADGNVGVNATVTGGVKDCRGLTQM